MNKISSYLPPAMPRSEYEKFGWWDGHTSCLQCGLKLDSKYVKDPVEAVTGVNHSRRYVSFYYGTCCSHLCAEIYEDEHAEAVEEELEDHEYAQQVALDQGNGSEAPPPVRPVIPEVFFDTWG